MVDNKIVVELASLSHNVGLARIIVAGFIAPLDPTVNEVSDITTAVSEAVTNAIIHGYDTHNAISSLVKMTLSSVGHEITIEILDNGIGIEDIEAVREPMYTTKPDMERSGLGFTVMESFMDKVEVISTPGVGTNVILTKMLKGDLS